MRRALRLPPEWTTPLFVIGIVASVGAMGWLGYRAIHGWRYSATLLAEQRASETVDRLVTALGRDMRGVQSTVLASAQWDQFMLDSPYNVRNLAASAFARYPYPESFFAWRGVPKPGAVVFLNRADRRPAAVELQVLYAGAPINTTGPPIETSAESLQLIWDWFFANGGTSRAFTNATVVGVSTSVDPKVKSSNSDEVVVGLARKLGNRGAVRVDYVYRKYYDFYGNYVNRGTGVVTDPRTRHAVQHDGGEQHRHRRARLQRRQRPVRLPPAPRSDRRGQLHALVVEGQRGRRGLGRRCDPGERERVPEYRQASWNYPLGYTNGDQRHKMRIWGTWQVPLPRVIGDIRPGGHAALRLGRAL